MNIRQEKIIEILRQAAALSTLDLARSFDVSDETIRRDLKQLAEEGIVEKFHGGVRLSVANTEAPFEQRLRIQAAAKQAMAQACETLVPDGTTLFLDNSSSACFLARLLARKKGLTIITLSLQSARILAEGGEGNRIIVPGGELRPSDMTITGASAIRFAAQFSPELFIFSVAAVSSTRGCLDFDLFEAEYKAALMPYAAETVLLADASKFGASGLIRTCGLENIGVLVTDARPPAAFTGAFDEATRIIVAE
jgi:DeoR family glycerol-3-phosphate regulon repressor